MKLATLAVVLFSIIAAAQTPVLTSEQKLAVRSAQVKLYEATAQKQNLEAQLQKAVEDAQKALQDEISKVYAAHKLSQSEYTLCENANPGPCAKAPANDLTFQPLPKAEKK